MPKFSAIPSDAFTTMVYGAGMLLKTFDVETGIPVATNIIGATSGGITATCVPTLINLAEGIDNLVNVNIKEAQEIDTWESKMSGTLKTITEDLALRLLGSADVDDDTGGIIPRMTIDDADFKDIWWVGKYTSSVDSDAESGFIAVHLMNAYNTSGLSIKTNDKNKGDMAFEFTGYASQDNMEKVPFALYIAESSDDPDADE